ncbi:D-alanyl-D-alanine carboxypeptidase family protein [Virgibacillus kekensis]|uniref:D-alanyl-D-alanine carboxypeptidase family protein n=1 Tax=Virgibacillus kekensis TaxID=202261 RepID=A0ABV9DJM5_9BACI
MHLKNFMIISLTAIIITGCSNGEESSDENADEDPKTEHTAEGDDKANKEKPDENQSNNDEQSDETREENPNEDEGNEKGDKQSDEENKENDKGSKDTHSYKDDKALPKVTLEYGDQGNKVKNVQQALNKLGYSLTLDGKYGWTMVWVVKDFQAQFNELQVDGIYGPGTRAYIEDALAGNLEVQPGSGMKADQNNKDSTNNNDQSSDQNNQSGHGSAQVISDPSAVGVLVNKKHHLPADYIPPNLVVPDVRFPFTEDLPKRQMRQIAANALEKMFAAADQAGVDLFAQSGYRSYDRQEAIFAANAREHGQKAANQFSAQPGESEHQTGLAMDVTSADINFRLTTAFANTDEGKWVAEHASDYGFIIRYPKGKTDITGYQYEPWHLRFVGRKVAKYIDANNITLDEYWHDQ